MYKLASVKLGYVESVHDYLCTLANAGIVVSDRAKNMLRGCTVNGPTREVGLVACSPRDLGFTEPTCPRTVRIEALRRERVSVCGLEVAPAYRVAYINQPVGETLVVASYSIDDGWGREGYLCLANDDGKLCLRANFADPPHVWMPDRQLLFRDAM